MKPFLLVFAVTSWLGAAERPQSEAEILRVKIQGLKSQQEEILKQAQTPCQGFISGTEEDQTRHLKAQIKEAKAAGRLKEARELEKQCNVISPAMAQALKPERVTEETLRADLKRLLVERLQLEVKLQAVFEAEAMAKAGQP